LKKLLSFFDNIILDARCGWMDLIRSDYIAARDLGYQNIVSPRGARASRADARKRTPVDEKNENNLETIDTTFESLNNFENNFKSITEQSNLKSCDDVESKYDD
jgi:hypothetical protein